MLKDPFDYLAIFDGFQTTRDELLHIQTTIDDRAKSIGQSAEDIAGVVKLWRADIRELGTTIGRDVHTNGYVALEKYVDELHERSVAESREIATSAETKMREIASSATTEWRALSANQQETFHRQLKEIAAAANGLPPLPPRPIAASPFRNCAYFAKLTFVHARRFAIEAKSFATLVLAVASVISAAALVFIAAQHTHGPISLSSFFR
ncbi:hypothetical protein OKW41_000323 [Paraburkholderia sp. UCT70]|uniref:hypothetical protein n=1 Tax=Paraburkholderia sp. UCT70 TaxID=2991068 RepID=UPI003D21AF1D